MRLIDADSPRRDLDLLNLQQLLEYAPEVEAVVLPPNDPLTLDELREMDGEPVWGADGKCYIVNAEAGYAADKYRGFRMLWEDRFFSATSRRRGKNEL